MARRTRCRTVCGRTRSARLCGTGRPRIRRATSTCDPTIRYYAPSFDVRRRRPGVHRAEHDRLPRWLPATRSGRAIAVSRVRRGQASPRFDVRAGGRVLWCGRIPVSHPVVFGPAATDDGQLADVGADGLDAVVVDADVGERGAERVPEHHQGVRLHGRVPLFDEAHEPEVGRGCFRVKKREADRDLRLCFVLPSLVGWLIGCTLDPIAISARIGGASFRLARRCGCMLCRTQIRHRPDSSFAWNL